MYCVLSVASPAPPSAVCSPVLSPAPPCALPCHPLPRPPLCALCVIPRPAPLCVAPMSSPAPQPALWLPCRPLPRDLLCAFPCRPPYPGALSQPHCFVGVCCAGILLSTLHCPSAPAIEMCLFCPCLRAAWPDFAVISRVTISVCTLGLSFISVPCPLRCWCWWNRVSPKLTSPGCSECDLIWKQDL